MVRAMATRGTRLGKSGLLLLLGALAPLAVAFGAQHLGGLAPCELCIWQRWGYGVVAAFAVLALLAASARTAQHLLIVLGGIAALGTAAVAIFHVGVEQHWWQGFTECAGPVASGMSTEEFEAAILNAPVVRCDEVAWSFGGISMAGYNAVYAIGLGLFAFVASRPRRPQEPA
jgi:disulfide bond formation protein DsbB